MEKNSFKWWQILCMGLLYLVFVFASCFIGFLHPACWAYFSVLAAILAVQLAAREYLPHVVGNILLGAAKKCCNSLLDGPGSVKTYLHYV